MLPRLPHTPHCVPTSRALVCFYNLLFQFLPVLFSVSGLLFFSISLSPFLSLSPSFPEGKVLYNFALQDLYSRKFFLTLDSLGVSN